LRNEITKYLLGVGEKRNSLQSAEKYILPELEPLDLAEAQYVMI
jgi:hypothetical protein